MPAAKRLILTDNENIPLRELAHAHGVPRRTRMRAMALRLNAIGWSTKQIADHLGWHEHTLRNTLKLWQNELIETEFIDDRTATQRYDWEIAQ